MTTQRLRDYLDREGVHYEELPHPRAFTAPEVAASTHISGRQMVKCVMVRIDDEYAMAVLPSHRMVDIPRLQEALGEQDISIATEQDFKELFPDCEVGAMPPFGNLYGIDVYVDEEIAEDKEIAFNAGSHTEVIRMSYEDFARLAKPYLIRFVH